jgi:preprotein translocase subunit SecG
MIIVFLSLIIIASIVLGLIILIQNPKGGGLASSFGGFGNQLMGVKQTTDVLEKGTWLFAAIIGVLCLTSAMFIPKTGGGANDNLINNAPASNPSQPANTVPFNNSAQPTLPAPSTNK